MKVASIPKNVTTTPAVTEDITGVYFLFHTSLIKNFRHIIAIIEQICGRANEIVPLIEYEIMLAANTAIEPKRFAQAAADTLRGESPPVIVVFDAINPITANNITDVIPLKLTEPVF